MTAAASSHCRVVICRSFRALCWVMLSLAAIWQAQAAAVLSLLSGATECRDLPVRRSSMPRVSAQPP